MRVNPAIIQALIHVYDISQCLIGVNLLFHITRRYHDSVSPSLHRFFIEYIDKQGRHITNSFIATELV